MHTCPHPLNDAPVYPRTEISVGLSLARPVGAEDICRTSCEENKRGFTNTELYYFGR